MELWKTNKPPAMQVSQHCFSFQKKTSGGIINPRLFTTVP